MRAPIRMALGVVSTQHNKECDMSTKALKKVVALIDKQIASLRSELDQLETAKGMLVAGPEPRGRRKPRKHRGRRRVWDEPAKAIVRQADGPISAVEVTKKMQLEGHQVVDGTIRNTLNRLAQEGDLIKDEHTKTYRMPKPEEPEK